jgi:hypothetical protein
MFSSVGQIVSVKLVYSGPRLRVPTRSSNLLPDGKEIIFWPKCVEVARLNPTHEV